MTKRKVDPVTKLRKLSVDLGITETVITKDAMVGLKITDKFYDSQMAFLENATGLSNAYEEDRASIKNWLLEKKKKVDAKSLDLLTELIYRLEEESVYELFGDKIQDAGNGIFYFKINEKELKKRLRKKGVK